MKRFLLFVSISFLTGTTPPFEVGESIKYQASFSGIDAATGTLEVIGKEFVHNTPTLHVRFSANTHGVANYLFPIKDEIDIWLDEETLFPIKVNKDIQEGKYKKEATINLFQEDEIAIIKKDTLSIPFGTHSPYSLFYYIRNSDISSIHGKTVFTIDGKKVTPLKMQVEEDVSVSVPAGDYLCTKVTPMRSDKKLFKNEATMSIWFSNDKSRYPVQIWIKMKFGAFILKLKEVIN